MIKLTGQCQKLDDAGPICWGQLLDPGPLGIKFWTASHSQPMCLEGSERSSAFSTFKRKADDLLT